MITYLTFFIIIVGAVFLWIIYQELVSIRLTSDNIEKIVVMTKEEKTEYDLRIENPGKYLDYIQDKYWKGDAERKIKDRKIMELIKRQPKLTLEEIAERYGESVFSLQILIKKNDRTKS